jgi:hypothetical protein
MAPRRLYGWRKSFLDPRMGALLLAGHRPPHPAPPNFADLCVYRVDGERITLQPGQQGILAAATSLEGAQSVAAALADLRRGGARRFELPWGSAAIVVYYLLDDDGCYV